VDVPRKYGLLRLIAFILKLFGWLVLLAGIAGGVAALALIARTTSVPTDAVQILRMGGIVLSPILGVVWFVQLFAFGSILSLLVDIEESTRALAATITPVHE
jgi:hypothetical protein